MGFIHEGVFTEGILSFLSDVCESIVPDKTHKVRKQATRMSVISSPISIRTLFTLPILVHFER